MFFKRLSRSRQNSYIQEDDLDRSNSQEQRPPSSYNRAQQQQQQNQQSHIADSPIHVSPIDKQSNMYSTRTSQDYAHKDVPYTSTRQQQPSQTTNGHNLSAHASGPVGDGYSDHSGGMMSPTKEHHPAPDPLTRAFNEALRPHQEKIEMLEQQLADMQEWVQAQEGARMDIYNWIDKRGLRPDVPPAIAAQMDKTPDASALLNAQLDRKITIVNFDLHRLQDDLNDSISSAHFASAMSKFLPDIQRLSSLSMGPRFAFELVIKLVGNLNSHGGLEATAEADDPEVVNDRRARAAFYDRMDEELVDVIRKRVAEGEDWGVAKEVRRLEKNAAYLKNLGIDSYFPRALEVMRRESAMTQGQGQGQGQQGTPPRY